MVNRIIESSILDRLGKGKVILILGPRQVGKTTLSRKVIQSANMPSLWLNGDEPDVRARLEQPTSTFLRQLIGTARVVVVDEAQRINNIGLTLKLLVDNLPDVQVIATGSSSLELSDELSEPLTGRKYEFHLFPFSFEEAAADNGLMAEQRLLQHRLLYGYYPEVVTKAGEERELLHLITSSYLYKDLFAMGVLKKPALLEKIVQALALQIGSEVSFNEIAQLVGADSQTVERYIDLLEKTFIVFRLPALSRNLRNEIKKGKKYYFWDNGIRNAILNNFAPLALRDDVGAMWENWLVSERHKFNHYHRRYVNAYFWRTHTQQEIDYIEEKDGQMAAFEFKWNPRKTYRFSASFMDAYPVTETAVIHPENFRDFILQ